MSYPTKIRVVFVGLTLAAVTMLSFGIAPEDAIELDYRVAVGCLAGSRNRWMDCSCRNHVVRSGVITGEQLHARAQVLRTKRVRSAHYVTVQNFGS